MTIKYATVTKDGLDYKVKFLGEELASETTYVKLFNYTPSVGDIVAFIADDKGKYLCLGKIK